MSKGISHITRRILVVVLAVFAFVPLCACYVKYDRGQGQGQKPDNSLIGVSDDILELAAADIDPYIKDSEMETSKTSTGVSAFIKIRLKDDTVEKVREVLGKTTAKEDEPMEPIPMYQDHPYALELKKMNVTDHFKRVVSGKNVKSHPINYYIAEKDGKYYVFVFA